MCETTFETVSERLQHLLEMNLTIDVTLLCLSALDNDKFVLFFMSQLWTMKLNESTNICHFSDRFATTIKVNIKEIFMGNDVFLKIFIW